MTRGFKVKIYVLALLLIYTGKERMNFKHGHISVPKLSIADLQIHLGDDIDDKCKFD